MKIIITGHTSGLGKSLYDDLSEKHDVIGLSRQNGHNLSIDLASFMIDDFDVYINNAYHAYAQTDLLYQLFDKNKYRECTIINIGSVSADGNRDAVNEYAIHKAALEKACSQLQLIDSECKVVHLKLGRMNTPMTDHKSEYPRMDTKYIANAIKWMIDQPNDILIKNLTLDIMHSRRKKTL
jgi:NAD(P)-dependent dehydrogenase (short-subunit alcohol dehydrogenase family)